MTLRANPRTWNETDMFEQPWPNDLPECCPHCDTPFQSRVHLVIGPGRASRMLKAVAYWMILPWMLVAVILVVAMDMPNFGRGGGYMIVGVMFVPPAMLAILGALFPLSRRLACNACGWRREFPMSTKGRSTKYGEPPKD